jgi:Protein of unknown function (DUF2637)
MTTPPTAARIENSVQVVILLFMGGMAGAASFVHIHDVTVRHGQPSWIGWANAVVIELMSIVAGLDIRRRKRIGQSTGSVVVVLLIAVGISLAAQVATAQPSVWGWIADRTSGPSKDCHPLSACSADRNATSTNRSGDRSATLKRRTHRHPVSVDASDRSNPPGPESIGHPPPGPVGQTDSGSHPVDATGPTQFRSGSRTGPNPHRDRQTGPDHGPTAARPDRRLEEMLILGQSIAADLHSEKRPLTRDALITGIRAAGHTISTDNASALLRRLKAASEPTGPPTAPPAAIAGKPAPTAPPTSAVERPGQEPQPAAVPVG